MPALNLYPHFQTMDDLPEPPLNWSVLFPEHKPVELEVGSGRGLFLVNAGLTCPEHNFCGIEYDMKEARRAARRLARRSMTNARMIGVDARLFLPYFVQDASVVAVHIYFPDPWWKRRHHKRRLFNDWFVEQASRILVPGGLLHAWTDVEDYFQLMLKTVAKNPDFVPLPPPEERPAAHGMDYHTSFERKKRLLGLPIYRARWQRVS
jgi:tRNA (guanine-N7-)-methyltransferase